VADPLSHVADRLAISDLVHAYAQGLDRRDPDAVAQLFSDDATFTAYVTPGATEPFNRRRGRADVAEALRTVLHYRATTHTIGNHLVTVEGDRAVGETRCVAYHVIVKKGTESLLIWHLRYLDTFVRESGRWRIGDRELRVDVVTEQPLRID
jgi:uncharacterized protein (TIGR02246 family)